MKLIQNKIFLLILFTSMICTLLISILLSESRRNLHQLSETFAQKQTNSLQMTFELHARLYDKEIKHLASLDVLKPCELLSNGLPDSVAKRLRNTDMLFLIVTDPDLFPVFVFPPASEQALRLLPANKAAFEGFMSDGLITRYYGWIDQELVRVSAIEIPWCQPGHTDTLKAWIFTGYKFDQSGINDISKLIQGKATLQREPVITKPEPVIDDNKVVTNLPLYGWQNLPQASVRLETSPDILVQIRKYDRNLIFILITSSLILLIFITFYLKRYYILPLRLITLAFKLKDPEYLRMIRQRDPDFNTFQNQMMNVFSQERLLNEMIRRRTTEKLNSFHAAILSQITDAVYATDHQGLITYWNKSAELLYGVPENEAIASQADVLVPINWDDPKEELSHKETLKNDGAIIGEFIQTRPNGETLQVNARITRLLDCNNELLGHLFVIRQKD